MKTNILENQDFLLGVQEDWDSYYEVKVKFIKEVNIGVYIYYLFADKNTEKSFCLSPRYEGHHIEGIYVEKQIVVNLFKGGLDVNQVYNKQPIFYATGLLKLPTN